MFSPDQFMHILTPSIWHITTPRYYLQRTNFIIRNQKCSGKCLQKVNLISGQPDQKDNHMSCLPNVVPLLVTRCFYRRVCLAKHQPDQQADDMPYWPAVVPVLTNRCLYWGGESGGWQGCRWCQGGIGRLHMKNEDNLLQSTIETSR